MLNRRLAHARAVALVATLAVNGFAARQGSADCHEDCGKHHYTLASLAGDYAVTGVFGPHAGGYVGTAHIDSHGEISNDIGVVVDVGLPAPLRLTSTGEVSINPDGTGLFTINVTVVGGSSDVPYHFHFVITGARVEDDHLAATRIDMLQQEPSPLPGTSNFASFTWTKRPD